MAAHFPNCANIEPIREQPPALATEAREWLSPELMQKAINSFGPEKAAGPDPQEAFQLLSLFYTTCIDNAYTPGVWCRWKVIYILKPNKEVYAKPCSFRPFSLTSLLRPWSSWCNGILKTLKARVLLHCFMGLNLPFARSQGPLHGGRT